MNQSRDGDGATDDDAIKACRRIPFFGRDRHRIRIIGDITEPLDTEWEADVDPDRVLNP